MGYIIAYLLLALVIDLIREIINPEGDHRNAAAIRRRLWSDTDFDCRSKVFGAKDSALLHWAQRPLFSRAKRASVADHSLSAHGRRPMDFFDRNRHANRKHLHG